MEFLFNVFWNVDSSYINDHEFDVLMNGSVKFVET
jgi:hypothetical protein